MSGNKEVSFEIDAEIEINASITPYFRGRGPSFAHAGGEPDEPSEVEDLVVIVNIGGESIDITELLTKKALKEIESQCFDKAADADADAREAAAEARCERMRDDARD